MEQDIRRQLAEIVQFYNLKGWSPATSTNYSFRKSADIPAFFVSRSGIDKSQFGPNDFLEVDLEGNPTFYFKGNRPSAETLIHSVIYKLFPATTIVLHSHSVNSVLISEFFDKEITFEGYEIQKAFAGQTTHANKLHFPILDNDQDMLAFSQLMLQHEAELKNHAFLIRKHGFYAWGDTLLDAKKHLEALEYLMEIAVQKLKMGSNHEQK
ncbi:MAG: methylthioribulose 1-phosphate dehydratase [Crocinitomicaceae bacterium]|nr:methylthioribulose 1-phosphate dehydratase [Crocinitomicaceae bacterium]